MSGARGSRRFFASALAVALGAGMGRPAPARAEVNVTADAGAEPVTLPAHLTLAAAEQIFLAHGFDLIAAQIQVEAARAAAAGAGAVPNPQFGGTWGRSFDYDPRACDAPGCSSTALGLSLSDNSALMDLASGRRGLRLDVAHHALAAARLGAEDARRTLLLALRLQYLQAALDDATVAFTLQVQETFARTATLFAARYREGAISEADLARIETAALEAEQSVDAARAQLAADKLRLAYLLGARTPAPTFELRRDWLDLGGEAPGDAPTLDDLVARAEARRPDLAAQVAEVARARAAVSGAVRLRVPDLNLNVTYVEEGRGNQAVQPPTLTLTLALIPPLLYQAQGEVAAARADLRAQELGYARLRAQVALDVGTAHAAVAASRARLTRMRERLRGRAARALELVELQYQKGAASLLELLDAERTFIATNQAYIDTLDAYWTARFTLAQAVGAEGAR